MLPVRCKKRNIGAYRLDSLRDFIVQYDAIVKTSINQGKDSDTVLVFTDETYIHKNHANSKTYLHKNSEVNRSASKGERLVILHAITKFGPLCEKVDDIPIDDLIWKGDTCHPTARVDGKTTAELIWKASSASGDYHDNMNSDMFIKWTKEKLLPTFETLHPGKKMVLVMDNAPYHHKREIGSLAKKNKKEIIEICKQYKFDYLDLPYTNERYLAINNINRDNSDLEVHEEFVRVAFNETKMAGKKNIENPFIPTVAELKIAVVEYLHDNQPHLLDCKVEQLLRDRGHKIIWTPPYTPDLQPIEMFWAGGKNHAASKSYFAITMKETVKNLREGWYGNAHLFNNTTGDELTIDNSIVNQRFPVNCHRLIRHSINLMNKKFIQMCPGISGKIGRLIVDNDHQPNRDGILIDMLIADVTRDLLITLSITE